MNVLQRPITLDELDAWGARELYGDALIQRWMKKRDAVTVEDTLATKMGLSRVFWTVMREEILPAAVLKTVALRLARHFVARLEGEGVTVDFRAHRALDVLERQLAGDASEGEVAAAREEAVRARADQADAAAYHAARAGGEADLRASTGVNAAVHALDPDGRTAARGVLYAMLDVYPESESGEGILEVAAGTVREAAGSIPYTPQEDAEPAPQASFDGAAGPAYEARPGDLPVGTIVAWAGLDPGVVIPQGWLLCDGRELRADAYPELFDRIGTAFGTPRPGSFNLPQLQGLFLRGVTGASPRDPDAYARTPLQPGGNLGNGVGSLQPYATALPKAPFTVTRTGIESTRVDKGCGQTASLFNTGSEPIQVSAGGDRETRPRNKAVHFLIQCVSSVGGEAVVPPIGAVIPFAGINRPAGLEDRWLLCDGTALDATATQYEALFRAIGHAHGTPAAGRFNLPDYRGWFLRGVAAPGGYDPDAATRYAPLRGGNAGPLVGSAQGPATGLPRTRFTGSMAHLPVSESSKGIAGLVYDVYAWAPGSSTIDVTAAGTGDAESRPVNVSVDWFVRYA